jgi:hypothetical protein
MNFKASQFDYNPASKTYVAEASDLRVGITMPYITLDGCAFMLTHTDMDASGEDVYGWRYTVTIDAVQFNPALAGCKVLLIND